MCKCNAWTSINQDCGLTNRLRGHGRRVMIFQMSFSEWKRNEEIILLAFVLENPARQKYCNFLKKTDFRLWRLTIICSEAASSNKNLVNTQATVMSIFLSHIKTLFEHRINIVNDRLGNSRKASYMMLSMSKQYESTIFLQFNYKQSSEAYKPTDDVRKCIIISVTKESGRAHDKCMIWFSREQKIWWKIRIGTIYCYCYIMRGVRKIHKHRFEGVMHVPREE